MIFAEALARSGPWSAKAMFVIAPTDMVVRANFGLAGVADQEGPSAAEDAPAGECRWPAAQGR